MYEIREVGVFSFVCLFVFCFLSLFVCLFFGGDGKGIEVINFLNIIFIINFQDNLLNEPLNE